MTTKLCNNQHKIIAQTLFLGASVSSFNTNTGWGGQPSSLTVNLVEDSLACSITQFSAPPSSYNIDNYYYTCVDDDCYVNSQGKAFSANDSITEKMVPGKIVYKLSSNFINPIVSNYYYKSDPGFFGHNTRIKPDGTEDESGTLYKYDIIDTPVYFKMGDFSFCGMVQSWNKNLSSGGENYTVIINSFQSLLNSSYIITNRYGGSIFSKPRSAINSPSSSVGSPKNYLGSANIDYFGRISEGNLPNVFNVYGFLESMGVGNFGIARPTEDGVSVNKIVSALSVLTGSLSSLNPTNLSPPFDAYAGKQAFSPYGRIVAKHAQLENTYQTISSSFNQYGLFPPQPSIYNNVDQKCQFILDLSSLPSLPDSVRISSPVITITDLLNTIADAAGLDYIVEGVPIVYNNQIYNIIKVKTISRLSQPRTNQIENTIKELECNNYSVSATTIGKEKNETNARALIIGGQQQRLYQAKSYRLAYTQSTLIFDPTVGKFVDYMQLGSIGLDNRRTSVATKQFHHGKIKFPNFLTTRNPLLANQSDTAVYSNILLQDDNLQSSSTTFTTDDAVWADDIETAGGAGSRDTGNYISSISIKQSASDASSWGTSARQRWFPIHLDVICPFYGFVNEEELNIPVSDTGDINATLKQVRPVWLDTWTGQTVVVLRLTELPKISVDLLPIYQTTPEEKCSQQNNNRQTKQAQAQIVAVNKDGAITRINITDGGAGYSKGSNPKITITGSTSGKNASFKAVVVGDKISYIDIVRGGEGYKTEDTVQITAPKENKKCLSSTGNTTNPNIGYFILTESEIRAALAGFDNFLVYSLAKLYKPDLIEMLRRAHKKKIKQRILKNDAVEDQEADKIADKRTNWYWNAFGANIASKDAPESILPGAINSDGGDGASNIPEDALKDMQILHKFVSDIGKYYGKKYMVTANNLQSYKDEAFANLGLSTSTGYAYVFSGDGQIKYNYTPTNDGAWEEYGNFIDDSILVGGTDWYNITDDTGKIKPMLGYNASYHFDDVRYAMCQTEKTRIAKFAQKFTTSKNPNPMFHWNIFYDLMSKFSSNCDTTDFIVPTLDISSLSSKDYILTEVYKNNNTLTAGLIANISSISSVTLEKDLAKSAMGRDLNPIYKQKLYIATNVDESFVFLDPINRRYPKFLIDAPGIYFNSSESQYAQDPNRTVISNVNIEDLSIYLKTTPKANIDKEWVMHMLRFVQPKYTYANDLLALSDNEEDIATLNLMDTENNQSALRVEIHPKATHPFFAAIPIKSNQYNYGPWTNYPYLEEMSSRGYIFPDGKEISQDTNKPPTCSSSGVILTDQQIVSAVDNWISATDIEFKDDFVPWSCGGMCILDSLAYKEIETKVNYQSIIETAQVDMPGLPLFNLGGNFNYDNISVVPYNSYINTISYVDTKQQASNNYLLSNYDHPGLTINDTSSSVTNPLNFDILSLYNANYSFNGPIITSIQTSVGSDGIKTTYAFRTYTKKLGLFNKEASDNIKRFYKSNLKRNKQIAELTQQFVNVQSQQKQFLDNQRSEKAEFNSATFRSRLYGWSPSTVLIGQSIPYLYEPLRSPNRVEPYTLYSDPGDLGSKNTTATKWEVPTGIDIGEKTRLELEDKSSILSLSYNGRMKTSVGMYDIKEVNSQLTKGYGTQSAMSLDGLLSPISFYPVYQNACFSYSLYDKSICPFCFGTKKRSISLRKYLSNGRTVLANIDICCDKCSDPGEKLNAKLKADSKTKAKSTGETLPPYIITSGTDFNTLLSFNGLSAKLSAGSSSSASSNTIPINLVTLNPIVVPIGEFKNSNTQNYEGAYKPYHKDISSASPGLDNKTRQFRDKQKHCIEIIARGSVPQTEYGYKYETSKNLIAYSDHMQGITRTNLDYYNKDVMVHHLMTKIGGGAFANTPIPELNQRFFGLRGPLVMHGWGYDTEGYPVPNAADEPLAIDEYGRPKRFKVKRIQESTSVKYSSLKIGDAFVVASNTSMGTFAKTFNNENIPTTIPPANNQNDNAQHTPFNNDTLVYKVTIEDDYDVDGGFDPNLGYTGSIISKTQEFIGGKKWSKKKKMKEFYLNWAERPDLWPVGPLDLRWDNDRNVWCMPPSNNVYKFVYVTLEEDLIKENDFDETYPARGFLDDLDYINDTLPNKYRRLVYIKDRSGYTAPRGVKLLCRYDSDSGFYEPISKPVIITTGRIANGNTAAIQMNYVQGRKTGQIPTMEVVFDNSQFQFPITAGKTGMFTYLGGKWILTSVQLN